MQTHESGVGSLEDARLGVSETTTNSQSVKKMAIRKDKSGVKGDNPHEMQ